MAKTELQELGEETDEYVNSTSKMKKGIEDITGVNIMKNNKEFKSTFEILKEIAAVQDKLSDIDKANVLEQLFGKRQANIGASILKNFDQANRALDASLNSAGSAATEHERWMQSIEASENKAKTAVEEFSNAFMSSGLVKFSYDAKAGILGFLTEITEKIGALPLAASGLAGALSLKNKGIFRKNELTGITSLFGRNTLAKKDVDYGALGNIATGMAQSDSTDVFSAYSEALSKAGLSADGFNTSTQAVIDNVLKQSATVDGASSSFAKFSSEMNKGVGIAGKLKGAFTGLGGVLLNMGTAFVASVAISAIIKGIDHIVNAEKYASQALQESASKWSESKSKIESLNSELENTKSLLTELEKKSILTPVEQEELKSLKQQNNELERRLKIENEIEREAREKVYEKAIKSYNKLDSQGNSIGSSKLLLEALQEPYYSGDKDVVKFINENAIVPLDGNVPIISDSMLDIKAQAEAYVTAIKYLDTELTKAYESGNNDRIDELLSMRESTSKILSGLYNDIGKVFEDADISERIAGSNLSDDEKAINDLFDLQEKLGLLSLAAKGENIKDDIVDIAKEKYGEAFDEIESYIKENGNISETVFENMFGDSGVGSFFKEWGWSTSDIVAQLNADFAPVKQQVENAFVSEYGSFDTLSASLYNTTDAYEKLKAAMDEQAKLGTLSVATYKELIDTNEGFAGYLEQTANGWKLNTEAVNEYIEAQDATARTNALAALLDLDEKIADAQKGLTELSGDELVAAKDSISAMEDERKQLAYLISSLDQAAGAYQNYLSAKETANSSDLYDASTSMYEEYKKSRKQGRTGTDEFQASTEYILGKDWDKDIEDSYDARLEKYKEAEKKYKRYFGQSDEINGAVNFLKDAASAGLASGNDVDGWILNAGVSMEQLAEATGTSVDAVSALIGLMEDHEIDFGVDFEVPEEAKQSVEEYTQTLELADKKREEAAEITKKASEIDEKVSESESGTWFTDAAKKMAESAAKTLEESATQIESAAEGIASGFNPEKLSVDELVAKIQELQTTITALNEAGISIPTELTGQYEVCLSMLDSLGLYVGQDNQVHVKVNDDGTAAAIAEEIQNIANGGEGGYKATINSETPDVQANNDALDAVANKERTAVITAKIEEPPKMTVRGTLPDGTAYELPYDPYETSVNYDKVNNPHELYLDPTKKYGKRGQYVDFIGEDGSITRTYPTQNPELAFEPTITPGSGEKLIEEVQDEVDSYRGESFEVPLPEGYTPPESTSTSGLADSIGDAESNMSNLVDSADEFYGLVAAAEEAASQIGDNGTLELSADFDKDIASAASDLVYEVNELNKAGQGNSNLDKQSSDLQSAAADFVSAYNQFKSADPANEQEYAAASESLRSAASDFSTAYSTLKSSLEAIKPVNVRADTSAAVRSINALKNRSVTIQVRANVTGMPANARGTRYADPGLSIVDEEGPELIEHTSRGTFEMGTNNGARFTVLDKGDVVHTADETKSIMKRLGTNIGGLFSKGLNAAKGILSGGAFKTGYYAPSGNPFSTTLTQKKAVKSKTTKSKKSKSKSSSKKSSSNAIKNWEDYLSNLFDWVEVRLERLEQSTNRWVASAAEAIGYSLKNAQLEGALSSVADQIDANTKGYAKYIEQADEVAKKLALSEEIIQKVKDGSIEIASYDDDTQKKINAYKEWYDKAVDCKDALSDLREQEQELAGEKLDNILNHYQWRVDRLDAIVSNNDALIDLKNATGAEIVTSDYDKALVATSQKVNELSEARVAMAKEFASLVERGLIAEGTEAWNDYTGKLEDLDEEIINTKIDLQKLNDSVSKITITNLKYSLAYLESIAQKIDGMMALHEAQGSDATDSDYESLIKNGMQQIQNLEAQNDEYRKQQQGLDVLSEKYQELQDNIDKNEKAILDMKTAQEEWNDSVIDNRIKEIQDYQEELQKSNDKLQRQKELQQAIEDLERARTQRNKRVYRGADKGFVYEADQDAIRSAQEKFDQTIHDETINKMDDIIDALEDFKDDTNIYDAMGNLLGKEYALPNILDYSDLLSLSSGNNVISEAMKAAKDAAYQQVMSNIKNNTANNISIGDITVQGVDDANGLAEAIVDQLGNAVLKEMYNRTK